MTKFANLLALFLFFSTPAFAQKADFVSNFDSSGAVTRDEKRGLLIVRPQDLKTSTVKVPALEITSFTPAEIAYEERVKNQVLEEAFKKLTRKDVDDCIDDFRKSMHDPDSFEFVGPMDKHVGKTIILNQCFEKNGMTKSYCGKEIDIKKVSFTSPIRATNGYGAKVLSRMNCDFSLGKNKELIFLNAWSFP